MGHLKRIDLPHLTFPGMSQAVVTQGFAHLSGQVAFSPDGLVGEGDARAQADQCFANIAGLLEELGAEVSRIVLLRAYLVDADDYAAYAEAKRSFLGAHAPAGAAVIVAGLLDPRLLVEVEAVVSLA